jgi:hypothetical protein
MFRPLRGYQLINNSIKSKTYEMLAHYVLDLIELLIKRWSEDGLL